MRIERSNWKPQAIAEQIVKSNQEISKSMLDAMAEIMKKGEGETKKSPIDGKRSDLNPDNPSVVFRPSNSYPLETISNDPDKGRMNADPAKRRGISRGSRAQWG